MSVNLTNSSDELIDHPDMICDGLITAGINCRAWTAGEDTALLRLVLNCAEDDNSLYLRSVTSYAKRRKL